MAGRRKLNSSVRFGEDTELLTSLYYSCGAKAVGSVAMAAEV